MDSTSPVTREMRRPGPSSSCRARSWPITWAKSRSFTRSIAAWATRSIQTRASQVVPALVSVSEGQVALAPVHVSTTSQEPAEARPRSQADEPLEVIEQIARVAGLRHHRVRPPHHAEVPIDDEPAPHAC